MWRGRTTRTVAGVSDDQAVDEIENHPHAPPRGLHDRARCRMGSTGRIPVPVGKAG